MDYLFLWFLDLSHIYLILIHKFNSCDLRQLKMVKIKVLTDVFIKAFF